MKAKSIVYEKPYIVLNPIAGHSKPDELRELLDEVCKRNGWAQEIYLTTGAENEDISHLTQRAVKQGADLVIAAGGDGTVSLVVNGLIGTNIPLGILPVGTGNGLARAMGVPLDFSAALDMIAGENIILPLDTMQAFNKHYVLNVSAGISSRSMDQTPVEEKRRFGMLAYAQTMIKDVIESEPIQFRLEVDGLQVMVPATEVLVSNGEVLQEPPQIFGAREAFCNGQMTVLMLTAKQPGEFVRLAWDLLTNSKDSHHELHDLTAEKCIRIDVAGESQPVQADGELIGETPVEIRIFPQSVRVIVPPLDQNDSN